LPMSPMKVRFAGENFKKRSNPQLAAFLPAWNAVRFPWF